jgi:hypothetical protein
MDGEALLIDALPSDGGSLTDSRDRHTLASETSFLSRDPREGHFAAGTTVGPLGNIAGRDVPETGSFCPQGR